MRSTVALYYFFVFALHQHRKRDLYTYNMKERTKRTDNKFAGRARERGLAKKNTLRADLIRSFLRIKRCCRCVCINWQNKKTPLRPSLCSNDVQFQCHIDGKMYFSLPLAAVSQLYAIVFALVASPFIRPSAHRPFDFLRRAVFQFIKLVSNAAGRLQHGNEPLLFSL